MNIRMDTIAHMKEDCKLAKIRIKAQYRARFVQCGYSEAQIIVLMNQLERMLNNIYDEQNQ